MKKMCALPSEYLAFVAFVAATRSAFAVASVPLGTPFEHLQVVNVSKQRPHMCIRMPRPNARSCTRAHMQLMGKTEASNALTRTHGHMQLMYEAEAAKGVDQQGQFQQLQHQLTQVHAGISAVEKASEQL